MANADYQKSGHDRFTGRPGFQRGMRHVRLGRGISIQESMATDALYYEYGRQFAAMWPEVSVLEIKQPSRRWANVLRHKWNEFARTT